MTNPRQVPPHEIALKEIAPRLISDTTASAMDGYSVSWHRNTRYEDIKRAEQGLPPKGPEWIRIGRNIRYPFAPFKKWLESVINGTHPEWQEDAA